MKEHSNPLEYLLQCCEDAINTGHWKLTKSNILNAKDELDELRQKIKDAYKELFDANQALVEEINRNLRYKVVAYGLINEKHDLYGLRLQNNPLLDQNTVVPLYSNREEFLKEDWKGYDYGKHRK
jgi:hypothetical protein